MKNIVLMGFMGTGKTAIGKALARELNFRFIDTDDEIEKVTGLKIREVLHKFGTIRFRSEEQLVINRILQIEGPKVIATGGCNFGYLGNLELLQPESFMVLVTAPAAIVLNRIIRKSNRVLLPKQADLASITSMMSEAMPEYQQFAQLIIDSSDGPIEYLVGEIKAAYQLTAK